MHKGIWFSEIGNSSTTLLCSELKGSWVHLQFYCNSFFAFLKAKQKNKTIYDLVIKRLESLLSVYLISIKINYPFWKVNSISKVTIVSKIYSDLFYIKCSKQSLAKETSGQQWNRHHHHMKLWINYNNSFYTT